MISIRLILSICSCGGKY